MPMPKNNENTQRLIEELAEWARGARLREFTPQEITSALATSGLTALQFAGVTYAQATDIIDYHYAEGIHRPTRPRAQA